jgi:hypothetical protein
MQQAFIVLAQDGVFRLCQIERYPAVLDHYRAAAAREEITKSGSQSLRSHAGRVAQSSGACL